MSCEDCRAYAEAGEEITRDRDRLRDEVGRLLDEAECLEVERDNWKARFDKLLAAFEHHARRRQDDRRKNVPEYPESADRRIDETDS